MQKCAVLKKLLVAVVVLSAFCGPVFAAQKLTQITENVYAYVDTKNSSKDNSFGANAGIIIGKDGIVVVDTLISSKKAKRFIRDIRAVSRKPVKYVVNTHYHLDHVFGNYEFAKLGAVIIAQENDKKAMENIAEETLKNIGRYGLTPDDMKSMDVEKIIPGHGPLSVKKDLDDMKAYILMFDQKAKELASSSSDVQEIATAIQKDLPQRPEGVWLIAPNIQMKYLKK